MLRIIMVEADASMAANVGGPVQVKYRTFEVELPELENLLRDKSNVYLQRSVCGVELIEPKTEQEA